jgi:triacylglycerol lipase
MSDADTETMPVEVIPIHSDSFRFIPIHSNVTGRIEDMPFLQQSLLFAELASLSYYNPGVVEGPLAEFGFTESQFFNRDGAQAWVFSNEHDCIVACRGTEPNEWNDIKADVNALGVVTETFGKVHRGFNDEVNDLWPRLEDALQNNERR